MSEETTTSEQLAEIEGQATQYTPPEGWRLLPIGETLLDGDVTVRADGYRYPTERVGSTVGAKQRYIRQIEIEPEPQSEPQSVQVREGRWKTRGGDIRNVTPTPADHDLADEFPWWDGSFTFRNDGRYAVHENAMDLLEYLGPIEPEPQPADTIDELRSEISYVQRLLGESRQRVTQLEELVKDLRTINDAAEKAVDAAGQENTALRRQLEAVKEELKIAAAVCQQLQIELDAAQQVPQAIADRFEEGWNQGTARAVETVLAWLEPIRLIDHPNLANETMQHLPQIMRHLTGLAQD
jgi:hypothetical protein